MATTKSDADKLSDMAHEAIDKVIANAADAEERIKKAVIEAETQVKASSRKAQRKGNDMIETVTELAKSNPLASIGIAFVIGFLISSLFRRD